jgi:hypothetical protein
VVQKILVDTLHVRTYVIWIPMLDRDEGSEVPSASGNVAVSPQYFDGDKRIGNELARQLGIDRTVWDAFLFYPPGAVSTEQGLPAPAVGLEQTNAVVVGLGNTLPAVPDQSRLPPELAGKAVVVGAQARLEALLDKVARAFVAHPG